MCRVLYVWDDVEKSEQMAFFALSVGVVDIDCLFFPRKSDSQLPSEMYLVMGSVLLPVRRTPKQKCHSGYPKKLPSVPATYKVKPGDTLYAIAWLYGLDFRALARYNQINAPYGIVTGQVIKLDSMIPSSGRYVVKRGDNFRDPCP